MATPSLHVVMFPWFAIGHITPFLQLSNKLAEKGHRISFLIPTKTLSKFQNLNLHPDLITFVPLVVPHVEGLPTGAETMSDVPISMSPLLGTALDLMEHHVKTTLQNIKPDFVFFDFAYWIPNIGQRLGFKSIFYIVLSAATFSYRAALFQPIKDHQFTESDLIYPSPGCPHSSSMQLQFFEARPASFLLREFGKSGLTFRERMTISISESNAISFRTCREIEGPYCDYLQSQWRKKILLTGPVLPDPSNNLCLEERWETWLGGFKGGSVIYCAFGSECVLEKDQFQELVIGLEHTGFPFLVVLKPPFGTETVESALPDGFGERVKGRGLVYGGWVQQQLILKHPSIGCFVSHCGSASMWESLMNDCQIVLIPHIPAQYIDTKLMSQVLKVAVAVERGEDGWFSRVDVCKSVQLVMNEGSELGNEVKRNHAMLKSIMLSEGFESSYMDDFNQNLYDLLQ